MESPKYLKLIFFEQILNESLILELITVNGDLYAKMFLLIVEC